MGIRFHCHHCERRLNVKIAQAGGQGQCPHCFGKITVPEVSTIPSEPDKQLHASPGKQRPTPSDDSSFGLHAVDEQMTIEGLPAEKRQQGGLAKTKAVKISPPSFDSDDGEQAAAAFMLDKPKLPATMGKIDPIAEAPTRIWYFRSRELGERGPLKAKAMQEHLDQGNVQVGCIVWREDWNDWLPAERVFPSLVAEAKNTQQKARVTRAFKESNYKMPQELDPQAKLRKRERRKNQIFVAAVAVGIVIIIVLLVVLLKLVADNP